MKILGIVVLLIATALLTIFGAKLFFAVLGYEYGAAEGEYAPSPLLGVVSPNTRI